MPISTSKREEKKGSCHLPELDCLTTYVDYVNLSMPEVVSTPLRFFIWSLFKNLEWGRQEDESRPSTPLTLMP